LEADENKWVETKLYLEVTLHGNTLYLEVTLHGNTLQKLHKKESQQTTDILH